MIGQLADAVGIAAPTVRFYERKGLLPAPQRADNGYRVYDNTALSRLQFIRSAQAAGLTLAEIRGVTDIRDRGEAPCTHVEALLDAKLAEIRRRREELAGTERQLRALLARGRQRDPADCGEGDICHILGPDHGRR